VNRLFFIEASALATLEIAEERFVLHRPGPSFKSAADGVPRLVVYTKLVPHLFSAERSWIWHLVPETSE
jgi:hypothetical protein